MNVKSKDKTLTWLNVAAGLVSTHYGLGFLLGSGEDIYNKGPIGILYALSASLGLLSLAFIASFYWTKKFPIWDLMGEKYGKTTKELVTFLSGLWMFGVVSAQILGGASALKIFGLGQKQGMLIISALIAIMSMVDLKKLSKIFFYMLIFSSAVLLLILFTQSPEWFITAPVDFAGQVHKITISDIIGTVLTTILITFLGMDFHQFIVTAKSKKDAVIGSIASWIILTILSFMVLGLVSTSLSNNLVNAQSIGDPREIVPLILYNFGHKVFPILGFILSIPILLVSIGSGSGVTKIVNKTFRDFAFTTKIFRNQKLGSILCVSVSLALALTGKSIISLIVSFYAMYVAAVFVPFVAYLLENKHSNIRFSETSIKSAITTSMIASLFVFAGRYLPLLPKAYTTTNFMIIAGFLSSLIVLSIAKISNK